MSLSKEAKALRVALQAAGVTVDACAQTLMVTAAKYIEERNTNTLGKAAVEEMVGELAKLPAGSVVEPKLTYPEEVAAESNKPAKPKAKKLK